MYCLPDHKSIAFICAGGSPVERRVDSRKADGRAYIGMFVPFFYAQPHAEEISR